MKFQEIRNEAKQRDFKDISTEEYRTYIYPGWVGTIKEDGRDCLVNTISTTVRHPIGLSISKSGHYVIDSQGITHHFPVGFVELYWKPKENCPNVVI